MRHMDSARWMVARHMGLREILVSRLFMVLASSWCHDLSWDLQDLGVAKFIMGSQGPGFGDS